MAHLWGPIRAYWAKRKSRGVVTVCKRSPRDSQIVCQVLQFLESPKCLLSGLEASFCCVKPIPWNKHGVRVIVSRLWVVFSWVKSLGRPFTFWGLYKAPIVTLEDTIWSYPFWELCFLLLSVLPIRECSVLVDASTPLFGFKGWRGWFCGFRT